MKRASLHFVVDAGLAVAGLGALTTGLLLEFVLPAGSRGDTVAAWTRHAWGDVHLYTALALLGLIALHVTLHWAWVCNVWLKLTGHRSASATRRRLAGLTVAVALAAFIAALLLLADAVKVEHESGGRRGDSNTAHAATLEEKPRTKSVGFGLRKSSVLAPRDATP